MHKQDMNVGNDKVVEPSRPSSRSDKENKKASEDVIDLKLPKLSKLPELSKSPEKFNNKTSMIESMVNYLFLSTCRQ